MRKLEFKRVTGIEGAENAPVEVGEILATDAKRLLLFIFRSDDISEGTLTRIRDGLRQQVQLTSPGTRALVFALGTGDDFEVYEHEDPQ